MESIQNQGEQNESSEIYFDKPNLMVRIQSMMIDSVVIILLMFIAAQILNAFKIESGTVRGICFVLILLYEPILVSVNRTIGQSIMGLRVRDYQKLVKFETEKNINFAFSLLRYLGKLILGWISLLTIHSDKYGRAIHDGMANSLMTKE